MPLQGRESGLKRPLDVDIGEVSVTKTWRDCDGDLYAVFADCGDRETVRRKRSRSTDSRQRHQGPLPVHDQHHTALQTSSF